jgi:hypothetical protein
MVALRTEYKKIADVRSGALVFFIPSDEEKRKDQFKKLRSIWGEYIPQTVSNDVSGEAGETSVVYISGRFKSPRIILTGLGPSEKLSVEGIRRAAAVTAKTYRIRRH